MYIERDDFRQSYVVAKNEIIKFVRGKRLIVYAVIVCLVFLLLTAVPPLTGSGFSWYDTSIFFGHSVLSAYLHFMDILIILGATLFASNAIVSEYEERTALVLFTRPIKKTPIFLGKIVGCIIVEAVFVVLYYLCVAVVLQAVNGAVPIELFTSLGVAFMYIVAATGVAMLISSVLKKSGTSAVLVFFLLLMIIPIVSLMFYLAGIDDPWFIITQAGGVLSPPATLGIISPMEHVARACGVLAIWGLVTSFVAWFMFTRREF